MARLWHQFRGIGLFLLIMGGGMAWWWGTRPPDESLVVIQARGTLRVGLDASFPPFESMTPDGQIVGIDVEMAEAVAADLGVTVELVNIGFDGLYDALLARQVDVVISGLPYDPRWTADVAYSQPYFNAGQVLVTRADNASLHQVEDLKNYRVAIEWGSQADLEGRQLQQKMKAMQLIRQPTAAEALEAVLTQQADAAIVDAVTGVGALPRGFKIVTYLTDEVYVAAVRLQDQRLLEAINHSLTELDKSGRLGQLQAKWLQGK